MIFWKGRGIFILFFVIAGAAGAYQAAKSFGAGRLTEAWLPAIALWGATLGALLFAKLLGKTEEQIVVDPATRQQVRVKKEHSLYGLTGMSWFFLGVLSAGVLTFIAVKDPGGAMSSGPRTASAGEQAFQDANRQIASFKGTEAFGNNEPAKKLAQEFADIVKAGRVAGIEASKPSSVSLTKGNFLTYCQMSGEKCAFLVHVPELRHFTPEAKEWMGKVCWAAARTITATANPAPKSLAVGVRGALLYDRILTGTVPAADANPEAGLGLTRKGDDSKEALYPFFTLPRNPPATPAPAAGTKSAEAAPGTPAAVK